MCLAVGAAEGTDEARGTDAPGSSEKPRRSESGRESKRSRSDKEKRSRHSRDRHRSRERSKDRDADRDRRHKERKSRCIDMFALLLTCACPHNHFCLTAGAFTLVCSLCTKSTHAM